MDKAHLLQYAITGITFVSGLIAKEAVTQLFSYAKTTAASKTARDKARKAFGKNNRVIMLDVLVIGFAIATLILNIRSTAPITRGDVFWIALNLINVFLWSAHFMISLAKRSLDE